MAEDLQGTHYRKQAGEVGAILFKPGFGFVLRDRSFGQIYLLPEVNVGYVLNDNFTRKEPYLFVELRFGFSYRKRNNPERKDGKSGTDIKNEK